MYADGFGGNTTTFINNEIEYLSKHHNLTFACIKKHDSGIFTFDNVKVFHYKSSLLQKIFRKLDTSLRYKDKTFAEELNSFVEKFKPDVIHCHFGREALKIIDNLENKNIPIVIHFHGYDASSALKSNAYVNRLKEVLVQDRIYPIFVAKYLRQNLLNMGIAIKNETILHCGIDLSKFQLEEQKTNISSTKTFLQVSSLVEKKGHEYTLQAFAKFLENADSKKYKLLLTGGGPRKIILQELASQLGVSDYVEFLGYVTPTEAVELMKSADVFVHHSVTAPNGDQEGIPTALMEAMAMELPVISTKHSGIPELVIDGVNGYLVDEKDVDAYAIRMADALKLGRIKENRDVIEEQFEVIKHNKMLIDLYNHIIRH